MAEELETAMSAMSNVTELQARQGNLAEAQHKQRAVREEREAIEEQIQVCLPGCVCIVTHEFGGVRRAVWHHGTCSNCWRRLTRSNRGVSGSRFRFRTTLAPRARLRQSARAQPPGWGHIPTNDTH